MIIFSIFLDLFAAASSVSSTLSPCECLVRPERPSWSWPCIRAVWGSVEVAGVNSSEGGTWVRHESRRRFGGLRSVATVSMVWVVFDAILALIRPDRRESVRVRFLVRAVVCGRKGCSGAGARTARSHEFAVSSGGAVEILPRYRVRAARAGSLVVLTSHGQRATTTTRIRREEGTTDGGCDK